MYVQFWLRKEINIMLIKFRHSTVVDVRLSYSLTLELRFKDVVILFQLTFIGLPKTTDNTLIAKIWKTKILSVNLPYYYNSVSCIWYSIVCIQFLMSWDKKMPFSKFKKLPPKQLAILFFLYIKVVSKPE